MKLFQKEIILGPFERGYHLITSKIVKELPALKEYHKGLLHIFVKHTSCGLTINENADPSARRDLENYIEKLVPDTHLCDFPFTHTLEGSDDMPAHIKSSLLGTSLIIPITSGRLNLGTWQGIYLCEFRENGGRRKLVLTLWGETD